METKCEDTDSIKDSQVSSLPAENGHKVEMIIKQENEKDSSVKTDCKDVNEICPDIKMETKCDDTDSIKEKDNKVSSLPTEDGIKVEMIDNQENEKDSSGPTAVVDNSVSIKTEVKTEVLDEQESDKLDPYSYTTLNSFGPTAVIDNSVSIKTEVKTEVPDEQESDKLDPYSYTKLNDFTSEIYKIEINNLPNYIGYGQLRKLLNVTLNLNPRKIKAIGSPPHFVFTTFRNEEDRDKALKCLNGYLWKGKTLIAKKANPAADPLVQKRKAGDSEDSVQAKKFKDDDIPIELKLKNAVTPFWNIPYKEQLLKKEKDVKQFLVKLGRSIEKVNKNLKSQVYKNRKAHNNQCCPLSSIKPSPTTTAYRNKCEFTVGQHLHTKEKTVGFRLNSYRAGSMSVAEPDDCINVSPVMLKAVKSFQDYVRASDKDVYNPENHGGYWRQLTVRTSNNNDVLIIAVIHPQSLSEDDLEVEKTKLKEYYEIGPGSTFGITSVYFQLFSKRECSDDDKNLVHLLGKKHLEETLLGMNFHISPESFFQINVPATEVLYSMVADYAHTTSESAVLDICCGTGTISLCLAKAGAKVVGIEMCPEAVQNAKLNAENNNIHNVEFICGKAEDTILTAISKCGSSEIIAVVDPPRAGLHQKVLKVIRATEKIKRLIYVSCNPNSACNNFVDLCRTPSNNYRGDPFFPIEAAVVDMFPHTPHKELVLIFERCPS